MEKKFGKVGNKIFEIWEVEKYLISNDILVRTIYYDKNRNAYDSIDVQVLTLKELVMTPHVEIILRNKKEKLNLNSLAYFTEELLSTINKNFDIMKLIYNGETLWEREDVMSVVITDSNGNKTEFKAIDLIIENEKVTMNMISDKGEN